MKPRLFKSERVENELSLEMRQDKLGNMFYCVHFPKCEIDYITFESLSSVLDFIKSNF